MPESNPDAVKLLSDDEVAEIAARRYLYAGQRILADRDALCATVLALRQELTESDRIIKSYNDQEWKTNTTLREQLAQSQSETAELASVVATHSDTIIQHAKQLAQNARRHFDDARELEQQRDELKDQLAQVTQEPLAATIDILEQRRRQLGAESIPEYARTINFLQAIVDEKKKEYPPLRAARSNCEP